MTSKASFWKVLSAVILSLGIAIGIWSAGPSNLDNDKKVNDDLNFVAKSIENSPVYISYKGIINNKIIYFIDEKNDNFFELE